ncbi:MAG: ATP-binding protein [Planctomycetota bacterium]
MTNADEEDERNDRDRRNLLAEVASLVTHQLHQPLTAIVNYAASARSALNREPPDPVELALHLERIAQQAFRAAEVSRELRDSIRRPALETVELSPRAVFEESWAALDPPTVWSLELALPDTLRLVVDPNQFRYVIDALLSNCADSLRTTEGRAHTIRVSARQDEDGLIEIAVEDDGPGFVGIAPSDALAALETSRPGHLGLGLSVSRSIAADHGGRLRAEAGSKGGALLRLSLPGSLPI